MTPKKKIKLTRLEMEVMEPLWKLGKATIRQIHENLPPEKRPEFTTLQTLIFRLEEKGALIRGQKEGHGFLFKPLINQKSAIGNLVDDFINLLGGTPHPLMVHLIETQKMSLEEFNKAEAMVNKNLKKNKK